MKELIHFGVRTGRILFFVGRMRILWAHVHLTAIVANLAGANNGDCGMVSNAGECYDLVPLELDCAGAAFQMLPVILQTTECELRHRGEEATRRKMNMEWRPV
jgi:hypothetical protein